MQPITSGQCGDLLAMWLEKSSSPDAVKQLVKDTGYNDSPFFGAEKKKVRIVGELVIVNAALAIVAVNQVFGPNDAKAIIDAFLAVARKAVFGFLEGKDPDFKKRYEQRLGEYFKVLSEDKPALAISFCFMKNLGLDPLKNMEGQLQVASRLGDSLTKTLDALSVLTLERIKNEKLIDTNQFIQREISRNEDKVTVDILHGAVFKNAQDFYQHIKSKGYYHPSGPLALLLKPDVYSWFVGYAALYVLCHTSEKYRAKAAQLFVVRNQVLREAVTLSAQLWNDLDSKTVDDLGKTPNDDSFGDDQASKQESKIFENHIQSLEVASQEAIKNMTVERAPYPYLPIYRIIGPIFGGIKDMDERQLAEKFNPIFAELLKKTGNVLNAL